MKKIIDRPSTVNVRAIASVFAIAIGGAILNPQPTVSQSSPPSSPPKVVFYGSSTTVGVGTTRGDRRWSSLLSRYLGWTEINEGLSGSTISNARRKNQSEPVNSGLERWRRNVLKRKPDRVVLLYGVNDAYWQLPLGTPTQRNTYRGDLQQMLTEMATAFQPHQLIVATPQPNKATLDRRAPYDRALQETTKQIGGYFLDAGKEAFSPADLAEYSADGLHMNNLGHAAFAAYMANKMVDLGIASPPPEAQGGNLLPENLQPLPGNKLRIDLHRPLSFGKIQTITAHWVGYGRARIGILRPDGRGGYEEVYRTPLLTVKPGIDRVNVPNWWVLDNDRLAVWTEGNCLGGLPLSPNSPGNLAVTTTSGQPLRDIVTGEGKKEEPAIGIYVGNGS